MLDCGRYQGVNNPMIAYPVYNYELRVKCKQPTKIKIATCQDILDYMKLQIVRSITSQKKTNANASCVSMYDMTSFVSHAFGYQVDVIDPIYQGGEQQQQQLKNQRRLQRRCCAAIGLPMVTSCSRWNMKTGKVDLNYQNTAYSYLGPSSSFKYEELNERHSLSSYFKSESNKKNLERALPLWWKFNWL